MYMKVKRPEQLVAMRCTVASNWPHLDPCNYMISINHNVFFFYNFIYLGQLFFPWLL